jgi:hypothetical protein
MPGGRGLRRVSDEGLQCARRRGQWIRTKEGVVTEPIHAYPTPEEAISELRGVCRYRRSTMASLQVIEALPIKWWVARVKLLLAEYDAVVEALPIVLKDDTAHNEVNQT